MLGNGGLLRFAQIPEYKQFDLSIYLCAVHGLFTPVVG
jgi:hypothetical protein